MESWRFVRTRLAPLQDTSSHMHGVTKDGTDGRISTRLLLKQDQLLLPTSLNCWKAVDHAMVDAVVLDDKGW